MTEIMMAIYTEPETALLLLDKCTLFITQYCRAIKDCGSAGVIIAEPAAGLLSNEDCMQYSSVFVKRIVEEVHIVILQLYCIIAVIWGNVLRLWLLRGLKDIILEIK